MSPDPVASGVVEVDHVWKRFRDDRRRRSLRDGPRGIVRRRGWRWALRDIDLRLSPGEAIGLIGANGSGKSTLLKILTQVMDPYAGSVRVGGQIGALIEIQAGLHPELTGRENVFLYGALLGLPRRVVAGRFDEIVEFAELETAIDRQAKFFSTGMRMRLGFSVAALLDPAVLLVDEVLAVGDASFQQRCLDRLEEAVQAGTTLVFVSHDLAAVEAISERVIWLDDGVVHADGPAADVLGSYRRSIDRRAVLLGSGGGPVGVSEISTGRAGGGPAATGKPFEVSMVLVSDGDHLVRFDLGLSEGSAAPVFTVAGELHLAPGTHAIVVTLDDLPLGEGTYSVWLAARVPETGEELLEWQPLVETEVTGPELDPPPPGVARRAPVHVASSWALRDRSTTGDVTGSSAPTHRR